MIRGYHRKAWAHLPLKVTVTDMRNLLYCPIKLHLSKTLGLQAKPTPPLTQGKLLHLAYQKVSLNPNHNLHQEAHLLSQQLNLSLQQILQALKQAHQHRLKHPPQGQPIQAEVPLSSTNLAVEGSIDLLEGQTPVEIKTRAKVNLSDLLQLTWYTLLLEDKTKQPINHGYIDLLTAQARIKVEINQQLRLQALQLRNKTQYALLNPHQLKPRRSNCPYCDLRQECQLLHQI